LGLAAGENVYAYAPNVWGWVDPLGLCSKTAKDEGYYASFMGKNGPKYYDNPSATLGPRGGAVWMSPLEDTAGMTNRAGVVTGTGHAPGPLTSYLKGDDIYGVAVPKNKISPRMPTAADPGANRHFRPGGFTGVEHNGVWSSSGVSERIIDGGAPMPEGSVFF
jgi:uncharacterized protein RhaS with RHS repeats